MARVLITGISGFTGRYVAQALAAGGHEIIGIARDDNTPGVAEATETHVADLGDLPCLEDLIAQTQPDRVVHLAAISFVSHSDVNEIYEANLIGTLNLLQALSRSKNPVEQVLLASSANVYGNRQGGQLTEEVEPLPSNHYGVSKLAMEHVARIMGAQLPLIVTRPFNYTGVGQASNFIIPKLVDHAKRGVSAIQLGNIDVARDFSDVRAVADAYARLLVCPTAVGQTFNICSGRSFALRDVIATIEELAGMRFDISVNPDFVRSDEIMELFGSRAKLETAIGPLAMPDLRETLLWMLES